ncbi:MAG TPA: hypothetical protein VNI57_04580, partial [Candidatus Saccharimonadales bacterium]|nr:hypothetical protein [Candidatus Saccharimonadales bacterium]
SNLGTTSSGRTTGLIAVLSADAIVDSGDTRIAQSTAVTPLAGGAMANFTLSGAPIYTVVGSKKICAKIDVDTANLNNQNGQIAESDETNNVQCTSVTVLDPKKDLVVEPGSVVLTPGPPDPNALRAGLRFQVDYGSLNQGIGAIRTPYVNKVRLGTSVSGALADPNTILCSKEVSLTASKFQKGGESIPVSHGIGDPNLPATPETCKIPFDFPEGPAYIVIQEDANSAIFERLPSGAPAESNNALGIPVQIGKPLDPSFRIVDILASDHVVEIDAPAKKTMHVDVAGARGLTEYSFTLTWAPAGMLSIGDPSEVSFSGFLESGGRAQSCAVTGIDPNAGTLGVACATVDPGGASAAETEPSVHLVDVTVTPLLPGGGTLTISNVQARDADGLAYAGPRTENGTFTITGSPDLSIIRPVPPAEIYPGIPFTTSFEIENAGFAAAVPPVITDVLVLDDPSDDPASAPAVRKICVNAETAAIPYLTTVPRTLTGCHLGVDLRPGFYTAFYGREIPQDPDPNNPNGSTTITYDPNRSSTASVQVSPRILALRRSGNGTGAETFRAPDGPAGTTGDPLASVKKYGSRSVAAVRSKARNLDWIVRQVRSRRGKNRVELLALPQGSHRTSIVLTSLRLPSDEKAVFGGADVDGDGEDELVVLRHSRKGGDALDFRRIDFTERKPEVCQSAGSSAPLAATIVAAAGIQYDPDPADEVAVVTSDGALIIYDVTFMGSLPPASPCRPVPTLPETAATAVLTPLASDPAFGSVDDVISICALDLGLDGVEEIGALRRAGSGVQSFGIFEPPAGPGGTAILVADDPEFGATQERTKARAIACTR